MVTLATPLWPALYLAAELTTGASKLNAAGLVPTSAPTVAVMASELPAPPDMLHCAVVALVQDVVEQALAATATVAVASEFAKSRPEIVTTAPDESGRLKFKLYDTTGASKVNARALVPTSSELTVTANLDAGATSPIGAAHETVVAVDHAVVAHTWLGSEAVAVLSNGAKLRPEIVSVVPEAADDIALTTLSCVGTGASKLNIAAEVPTKPETVTAPSLGSWV